MKTINHPLFIVLFSIHVVYYILKQTNIELPTFVTSYLADILSTFIVNTIALWIVRKIKNNPTLEFSPLLVLLSVILFSLYFEFYLPSRNPIYTSDIWDILCYTISGVGYVLWRYYGSKQAY